MSAGRIALVRGARQAERQKRKARRTTHGLGVLERLAEQVVLRGAFLRRIAGFGGCLGHVKLLPQR